MTLSTLRRSVAGISAFAGLVSVYLAFTESKGLHISFVATYALFGLTLSVMAVEERSKSKHVYPVAFALLAVANFALAAWWARFAFVHS